MIYAEKEQNESPFVSINTVARGRILPSKQPDGISEASPYQAKKQEDQSRAPSIQNGEMLHSKEKPNDFMTKLEGIDTNVAKIKKNSFITDKTMAAMDEDAIIDEEHPSSFIEPTESMHEKLKKKSQSNSSFWGNLYSRAKNFFMGYGAITNAERRINERDNLCKGVGNDPIIASVQASLVLMEYDLGKYGPRKNGVDGLFGQMTKSALKDFQQAFRIKPNEKINSQKIDSKTIDALNLAIQEGLKKDDLGAKESDDWENGGTVSRDNNQVIVKDNAGNLVTTYNRDDMKSNFQKLAQLQQNADTKPTAVNIKIAENFGREIYENYKDFFNATKDTKGGVSVIGLRGWGVGTPCVETNKIKGEKNTYDDMIIVIGTDDKMDIITRSNFEGTTATGTYTGGTLNDKGYPSIVDGIYNLHSTIHSGYDALSLNNNGSIPTKGENLQYPERGNPGYATGIEIHKGGKDWTWSKGCITIYAPKEDASRWDRFMSHFPTKPKGTRVGSINLMSL